jgi:hypothetical protein
VGLLLAWIAGSAFLLRFAFRLKLVSVDERFLHVSNYFKETYVPLTEVERIEERGFSSKPRSYFKTRFQVSIVQPLLRF